MLIFLNKKKPIQKFANFGSFHPLNIFFIKDLPNIALTTIMKNGPHI